MWCRKGGRFKEEGLGFLCSLRLRPGTFLEHISGLRRTTPEAPEPSWNLTPGGLRGTTRKLGTFLEPYTWPAPNHPGSSGTFLEPYTWRPAPDHPGSSGTFLEPYTWPAPDHPGSSGTFLEPYTWPAPNHPGSSGTFLEPYTWPAPNHPPEAPEPSLNLTPGLHRTPEAPEPSLNLTPGPPRNLRNLP